MVLNKEVRKNIKELCAINTQMYFTDDTLRVGSNDKTLIGYYDYGIKLNIPTEDGKGKQGGFGVHDVSELLSILSLYNEPTITEGFNSLCIAEGKLKNTYKYTEKECIVIPPTKQTMFDGDSPKIGTPDQTFELDSASFKMLKSQAVALKSPHIKFEGTLVSATDTENTSANEYTQTVEVDEDINKVVISADHVAKMIQDDYKVEVTAETVTFRAKNIPVIYVVIALS
jgi:hypothetical protein